jgi:uncharacterized membrane protein YdbT with pleckstrin-like domain
MTEQTYMIFHPTRLAFLKWYALAVLMFLIGSVIFIDFLDMQLIPFEYKLYSLIVFAIAGITIIALTELKRNEDDYAITSERIVEKTGLINIKQDSVYWEKLSNFSFNQSLFDRLFGIGTIELWSVGGEDKPQIVLKRAPHFKKIVELLNKLIQKR